AIDFIAEGHVVIHPDGTVAADRMHGQVNRMDVQTSTNIAGSSKQDRTAQSVSLKAKALESQVQDTASKKKHTRSNRTGYIILLVVGLGIGMLCWYRLKSGR